MTRVGLAASVGAALGAGPGVARVGTIVGRAGGGKKVGLAVLVEVAVRIMVGSGLVSSAVAVHGGSRVAVTNGVLVGGVSGSG